MEEPLNIDGFKDVVVEDTEKFDIDNAVDLKDVVAIEDETKITLNENGVEVVRIEDNSDILIDEGSIKFKEEDYKFNKEDDFLDQVIKLNNAALLDNMRKKASEE